MTAPTCPGCGEVIFYVGGRINTHRAGGKTCRFSGVQVGPGPPVSPPPPEVIPEVVVRRKKPARVELVVREMGINKTEREFFKELELRWKAGEVRWFDYEPIKLKLAKNTFYTPDFGAWLAEPNSFVFYEVKGFWRDDARVKLKCAAEKFPFFSFVAVTKRSKKDGGGWKYEEFSP